MKYDHEGNIIAEKTCVERNKERMGEKKQRENIGYIADNIRGCCIK